MANWLEVTIPAHGDPEALCQQLTDMGLEGFVIEDERDFKSFLENNTQYWDFVDDKLAQSLSGASRVKLWLADDDTGRAILAEMQKKGLAPESRPVADSDWENNWRDYYKPVEAGEKLVIVPQWHDYAGDRTPVRLDPGLLFGTGDHPTTRMCLAAVEKYAGPGKKVLDLGCGSGILGIAAAVLGAGPVVAADVDEKAPEVVRDNAKLNGGGRNFHPCGGRDRLGQPAGQAGRGLRSGPGQHRGGRDHPPSFPCKGLSGPGGGLRLLRDHRRPAGRCEGRSGGRRPPDREHGPHRRVDLLCV